MKRLCVFTLILCCLSWIGTQAQPQEVFPTKNAKWEVLIPAPDYDPPLKGTERGEAYLTYIVGTDSIIGNNGLKYYDLLVDSLYAGSLRTEGERVWITFDNGDHETLLYDFGVKVGDTVRQKNLEYFFKTPFYKKYEDSNLILFYWRTDSKQWIVQEIKEGIYGQEIMVTDDYRLPDIWCKGIGSLYGIFLGKGMMPSGTSYFGGCLWKQEINNIRNYPKQDYGNIQDQLGPGDVKEIDQIYQNTYSIAYNSDTKSLQISIKEDTNTYRVKIYCIDGSYILYKDLSNGENSILLSSIPSGVYLCKLSKDHQTITTQKIRL